MDDSAPSSRHLTGACVLVMALAAVLLLRDLGALRQPIWDESYYLATTARYHLGRLQFASHPPLGLMLIAAGDTLSGWNAGVDWRGMAAMGSVPGDRVPVGLDYAGIRIASALAGVLGAGLFFLLMAQITRRIEAGLMVAMLYLADPALLVQMRAGHLDAFQIAFALAAMLAGWRWLREGGVLWAGVCGAGIAAAALVRANGAALLVMVPMAVMMRRAPWRRRLGEAAVAGWAGVMMVAAVYAAHVAASPRLPDAHSAAGQRDAAHVSAAYRAATGPGARVWAAIGDQRAFMAGDLAGMARADANGSHPYGWPLGLGAITYRWDAGDRAVRVLALAPNWPGWWLSLLGLMAGMVLAWRGDRAARWWLGLWLAQIVVFMWLDGQRVLYLYHYFLLLMASHALLAVVWRRAGLSMRLGWAGLACVLAGFAFAAPVALHRADSPQWCGMVAPDCGPFSRHG